MRNQLVGSPFEKDVTIECNVEASPKSINYWIKDVKDGKFEFCIQCILYIARSMMLLHFSLVSAKSRIQCTVEKDRQLLTKKEKLIDIESFLLEFILMSNRIKCLKRFLKITCFASVSLKRLQTVKKHIQPIFPFILRLSSLKTTEL